MASTSPSFIHGDWLRGSSSKQEGVENIGLSNSLGVVPKKSGSSPFSIPYENPYIKSPYLDELYAIWPSNHNMYVAINTGTFVTHAGRDINKGINIIQPG